MDNQTSAVEKEYESFLRDFMKANQGLAATVGRCWTRGDGRGSFEVAKKGGWAEFFDGKQINAFTEMQRGPDFVLLYDVSRDCRVWLKQDQCSWQIGRGPTGMYRGAWEK